MADVCLIGAGLLGGALAERFLGGGLRVVGYDLREERRRAQAALGATAAESARQAAAAAPVIVFSLPNSDIVAAVAAELGPLPAGTLVVDTTTGEPEATAVLGSVLAARGVDYVDATVAGSSEQVRRGEAIVMAGGQAPAFTRAQPLVALFARSAFHVGGWGAGARMKLVVNLALGLNRAVLAEALALARASGVDLEMALEVLRAGPAYSRAMDVKGRKMITADYTAEARLCQHLKDVRLILDLAARSGVELPLSRLHEQILAKLADAGLGDLDNCAVFRAYDP